MDDLEDLTPADPAPAPAEGIDAFSRLFASAALGLAGLALTEVFGTIAVGLAVTTDRLNFFHRQGYAFLTQLEKSPVSLVLVVATVFAALVTVRPQADGRSARLATIALWAIVGSAALVGVGSVLGVLARFRVAELASSQPIDSITRRVLFTFIVRNFGAAVLALLLATGTLFGPRAKRVAID